LLLSHICFGISNNHYKDQAYPLDSLPKIKSGILMLFSQPASPVRNMSKVSSSCLLEKHIS
ncbi:hypothetical protein, partial [Legionella santicrucis]|uniref:hypothetical protein n=1 Tax=Legionella santicrucis TaxID=45074 RepID=UPI001A955E39